MARHMQQLSSCVLSEKTLRTWWLPMVRMFILLAVMLCVVSVRAEENPYPKSAIAIPGVSEHVYITLPKGEDSASEHLPPLSVFISLHDSQHPSTVIHDSYRQQRGRYVGISVLGIDKEYDQSVLLALHDYIGEQSEAWNADPNALFLVTGLEHTWQTVSAFTAARPDSVRGWLLNASYFTDHVYPNNYPPQHVAMGYVAMPKYAPHWQSYLEGAFADGRLVYDIPMIEEGDGYFMQKMRREKLRAASSWLVFAYQQYQRGELYPEQSAAYVANLQPPLFHDRKRGRTLLTPNQDHYPYLEDMIMWPGSTTVPWIENIAAIQIAMVDADYVWLYDKKDPFRLNFVGAQLEENKTWKRDNKDIYQTLRTHLKEVTQTRDKTNKIHHKSIEAYADVYQEMWRKADKASSLMKLGPKFWSLFEKYRKGMGGHKAREISWKLQAFAASEWLKRLRLPKIKR